MNGQIPNKLQTTYTSVLGNCDSMATTLSGAVQDALGKGILFSQSTDRFHCNFSVFYFTEKTT